MRGLRVLAAGLVLCLIASGANATIVITAGPGNVLDDENVLFNEPGLITSGSLVQGTTNQSFTWVDFFDAGEDLVSPAQGQARVEAEDGLFTNMAIALTAPPGGEFTSIIFNLNAIADGFVTLTVDQLVGPDVAQMFAVDGSGQNFYIATSQDGQSILAISIFSTIGIEDIRQIRIGFGESVRVPEPATLALFGAGLAALAFLNRWRSRKEGNIDGGAT